MENPQLICTGIVPCEKVQTDPKLGLLTFENIIFQVVVTIADEERADIGKKPKNTKRPMDVAVFWERAANEGGQIDMGYTLEFIDPQGDVLISAPGTVSMQAGMGKFCSGITLFEGVPSKQSGRHLFRIKSKDTDLTGKEVVFEGRLDVFLVDANGETIT